MSGDKHVYLVKERESLRLNEDVFKVGRTENLQQRMARYPKGSVLLACMSVSDDHAAETALMGAFKKAFVQRRDLGLEYFEGNPHAVCSVFVATALAYFQVPSRASPPPGDPAGQDPPGREVNGVMWPLRPDLGPWFERFYAVTGSNEDVILLQDARRLFRHHGPAPGACTQLADSEFDRLFSEHALRQPGVTYLHKSTVTGPDSLRSSRRRLFRGIRRRDPMETI